MRHTRQPHARRTNKSWLGCREQVEPALPSTTCLPATSRHPSHRVPPGPQPARRRLGPKMSSEVSCRPCYHARITPALSTPRSNSPPTTPHPPTTHPRSLTTQPRPTRPHPLYPQITRPRVPSQDGVGAGTRLCRGPCGLVSSLSGRASSHGGYAYTPPQHR